MTKLTTSQLLTEAKKYLWDGRLRNDDEETYSHQKEYICHAIDRVKMLQGFERVDAYKYHALIRTINDRLVVRRCNGQFSQETFKSWLRESAGISWDDLLPIPVQAHRLAWMNLLIAEYKAKGD